MVLFISAIIVSGVKFYGCIVSLVLAGMYNRRSLYAKKNLSISLLVYKPGSKESIDGTGWF